MTAVYRFGNFELQPRQRRLLADGRPVTLGYRAFDLLLALVERDGQLVTKDELLALVWPGLVVEENNLQVQVSTLRKILGSAAIGTVAGRGYRFTLELLTAGELSSSPVAQRHNLPPQLTSFIGHEDDLEECATLLGETRLLTLTGIGGCGKTRLALELAQRVLPSHKDGVWYVDMAPLLDAERVPLTVATTLDIREETDRPIVDTLCGRLAEQRMLLVVDNCEHLVAACAALITRMIGAALGVRVLAGSREGLGIPGERAMTVRSLSFPPPGLKHELRALEAYEAVRLFVERAQLSIPKFSLADDTADAVAEICRRLDGIPLAIELAAARVKILSVEEIRARLDDRFRLLTGGSKTALARQQTLLATIQWSYDHLSADEQRLLRQLSVFVGGWTLDGAVRVAGKPLDEYVVLDLLAHLVDQSLVTTHRVEGGTTRYSMLETVRQYAHERLIEAGGGETTRNRHLEFYLALAEEVGPQQDAWLARLDPELENFLAAHAWCDHAEAFAEAGLRLVSALGVYVIERGLAALGQRVAVEALARPAAQARNLARCRGLWAAGKFSFFSGRYGEAKDYETMSLAIARESGDEATAAEALRWLGIAESGLGNTAAARAHMEEALAIWLRLGIKKEIPKGLTSLGNLHFDENDFDAAERLYEEALVLDREQGNLACTAANLGNLAEVAIRRGFGDRAHAMVSEAMAIVEVIGSKRLGVALLDQATELAALSGDSGRAARLHGAAEAAFEQMSLHRKPQDVTFLLSLIAQARDSLGAATFAAAESAGRALSCDEAIADARAWLEQGL